MTIRTINGNEVDFIPGGDYRGLTLTNEDFTGLDLHGADFRDATCRYCIFRDCNLSDADFRGSDVSYARFSGADLSGANFRRSTYRGVSFAVASDTTDAKGLPCDGCDNPREECECMHCERCGEVCNDEYCSDCSRCSSCCNCIRCDYCNEVCESTCEDGRCDDCCSRRCEHDSDDDDGDFRETQPSGVQRARRGECARLAGVEYETTEKPDSDALAWARKWGAGWHSDGSCGYEAVTPPCAGSKIDACIKELADVIGETNDTCGIHVHVDATDYRWADTFRFLRVFAKVEGLLFVLGGQHRVKNTYCEPCGKDYLDALASDDAKNAVLALAYGVPEVQTDNDGKTRKGGKASNRYSPRKKLGGRYKSVNIAPWVFGRRLSKRLRPDTTFEFRLHRNGESAERVIGWTHLCVAIVEWCAKASDRDVKDLPRSALRALIAIAPASRAWILRRVSEWRRITRRSPEGTYRRIDSRTWAIKSSAKARIKREPVQGDLPLGMTNTEIVFDEVSRMITPSLDASATRVGLSRLYGETDVDLRARIMSEINGIAARGGAIDALLASIPAMLINAGGDVTNCTCNHCTAARANEQARRMLATEGVTV